MQVCSGQRLLGNLLVLSQYVNTLEQGPAVKGAKLPLDLKRAAALQAAIRAKREAFASRFVAENWNLMIDGGRYKNEQMLF